MKVDMMSRDKTVRLKKVKAIPQRRMDFYRRIQNSPERLRVRRKRLALGSGIVLLTVLLAAVLGVMYDERLNLEESVLQLESYVNDEDNEKAMQMADELAEREQLQKGIIGDYDNVIGNLASYPLVTSEVFRTLEECCPDKVSITITGYSSATGELQFDAVAPEVTDVAEVIETWKTLDIFQSVYFTGYTQNRTQEGYTVKVICVLSEQAGR